MSWRPRKRKTPSGKTVWVARYKDAQGQVRIAKPAWNGLSGTFERKREAQRAIDEALTRRLPDRASTVGAYLDRWLQTHPRSERTDRTNAGRIRNVLALELEGLCLTNWDMRELRRRHAGELVALMLEDQGRSPGGARNILRALSAMTEDAIDDELCEVNPWIGVRVRDDDGRAAKHSHEPRVCTFEEMHAVAAVAGRYAPMLRVLSDCGLRIGELFALQRSGLADGVLNVVGTAWEGRIVESSREKNHHREVPVPARLQALLREMPPRIDSPLLFPSPQGRLWRYSNWHRRVWQPAITRAGIAATPHEFRHSWVTHLRASGVDPANLADVAGHSVQTATSRYTHPL
ncbi:MAG: site-specific integrase, partial [Solirubrobacteraceae bacterium]